MNRTLKEVIDAVSRLPETDQEELASAILQELQTEAKWQSALNDSQPALSKLAEEALEEYRAGRTETLDPDRL
jgi:hypothetical protein